MTFQLSPKMEVVMLPPQLTNSQKIIYRALKEAGDEGVTLDKLVEIYCACRRDGGPDNAELVVQQHIFQIRRKTYRRLVRHTLYKLE